MTERNVDTLQCLELLGKPDHARREAAAYGIVGQVGSGIDFHRCFDSIRVQRLRRSVAP